MTRLAAKAVPFDEEAARHSIPHGRSILWLETGSFAVPAGGPDNSLQIF